MNIMKKVVSSVVTTALLATTLTLPSYAVGTFSTVQEFLTDVITLSAAEVESQTLDDAINTVLGKVTITDNQVFYNGTSIGYWYADSSSTLWTTDEKTTTAIVADGDYYTINPSTLYTLLYDLNENLEDNYVPSTDDWSKIIGKYDVKLGNTIIPAEQWIKLEVSDDPILDNKIVNLSNITGVTGATSSGTYGGKSICVLAWLVDDNGKLYLQNGVTGVWSNNGVFLETYIDVMQSTKPTIYRYEHNTTSQCAVHATNAPLFKVGLKSYTESTGKQGLYATYYAADATNSVIYDFRVNDAATVADLYKVGDPAVKNECTLDNAKNYGIVYFMGEQTASTNANSFHSEHLTWYNNYSTSKLVKGNQKLTRRLNALSTMLPTDTITVKADGWTVNGHDNSIDNYITDQQLNNAGDSADIAAVADIDSIKFHVIVPTALPIYVDDSNITYVANNADIVNKSGAAVELTGVEVVPEADSGWTMVDSNPSKEMEGHEFTFSTTIEQNKVLEVSEVYPFQYMANLSPTTESCSSLELAKVVVTVDWA